jgi:hypothetical protein
MRRVLAAFGWVLAGSLAGVGAQGTGSVPAAAAGAVPTIGYEVARGHEVGRHRRMVPVEGVDEGAHDLRVILTVSPEGDVTHAEASGEDKLLRLWPEVEGEVYQWRFEPFLVNGQAAEVKVKEYLDLVPAEKLPTVHVAGPVVRADSKVTITLSRLRCFGGCPAYTVRVTREGIAYEGYSSVVARGKHRDGVDAKAVRELAKRFVAADFYSMDPVYESPWEYALSIAIDGREMEVRDHVGRWMGMPEVVTELEDAVDEMARTKRWVEGDEGLARSLQAEGYGFKTLDAPLMLKAAAAEGKAGTVRELLAAGVPLGALPAAEASGKQEAVPFERVGWLTAGGRSPGVLVVLMGAGASREDQGDKDVALTQAAVAGSADGVRMLVMYGANPNADLRRLAGRGGLAGGQGSVLMDAAASGNPAVVREILRYHPKLEARDEEGRTAMFAAGWVREEDVEGARAECVRELAEADVNARDRDGNTPLHKASGRDVVGELLRLGADVNARNARGETPVFTTPEVGAIGSLVEHGADLSVRNGDGQPALEAAVGMGRGRVEALLGLGRGH